MFRFSRLFAVAIAAMAIAPATYAATGGTPVDDGVVGTYPSIDVDPAVIAGIIVTPPPALFPLPADPIDIPGGNVATTRTPAATLPKVKKPSASKQKGFWGTHAKAKRSTSLISDNASSQNQILRRNAALNQILGRLDAKQQSLPLITENSPSQNRVAPRKVAATRTLASTQHTYPA